MEEPEKRGEGRGKDRGEKPKKINEGKKKKKRNMR